MRRRFKLKAFITLVVVFALGILLPLILHASTDDNARAVKVAYTQQEFIETLAPTAQKMSKNYGVPASILLSPAAYASNYGSSLYLLNIITSTVSLLSQVKNVFV